MYQNLNPHFEQYPLYPPFCGTMCQNKVAETLKYNNSNDLEPHQQQYHLCDIHEDLQKSQQ